MKKLFEVEVRYYIMAEDKKEAETNLPLDFSLDACTVDVHEVSHHITDSQWVNAIPFNSDDDKTCGQIIDEMKK